MAVEAVAVVASVATFGAGAVIAGAVVGAVIGAVCGVAGTAISDKVNNTQSSLGTYVKNALKEGFIGALTGAVMGPLGLTGLGGAMFEGGVFGGVGEAFNQIFDGRPFDSSAIANQFGIGAITAGIFHGLGKVAGKFGGKFIGKAKSWLRDSISRINETLQSGLNKLRNIADNFRSAFEPKFAFEGGYGDVRPSRNVKIKQTDVQKSYNKAMEEAKNSVKKSVSNEPTEAVEKVNYGEHYKKGKNGRKELEPNVEYTTPGGHKYSTDELGRIKEVEGTLNKNTTKRKPYDPKVAGREDRLPTDDGGHLIASIFEGPGELDNLVPMNSTLNRGDWKAMENSWAKALKNGKRVEVKIEPVYSGNSQRPVLFKVKYKIGDGNWQFESFSNK